MDFIRFEGAGGGFPVDDIDVDEANDLVVVWLVDFILEVDD